MVVQLAHSLALLAPAGVQQVAGLQAMAPREGPRGVCRWHGLVIEPAPHHAGLVPQRSAMACQQAAEQVTLALGVQHHAACAAQGVQHHGLPGVGLVVQAGDHHGAVRIGHLLPEGGAEQVRHHHHPVVLPGGAERSGRPHRVGHPLHLLVERHRAAPLDGAMQARKGRRIAWPHAEPAHPQASFPGLPLRQGIGPGVVVQCAGGDDVHARAVRGQVGRERPAQRLGSAHHGGAEARGDECDAGVRHAPPRAVSPRSAARRSTSARSSTTSAASSAM